MFLFCRLSHPFARSGIGGQIYSVENLLFFGIYQHFLEILRAQIFYYLESEEEDFAESFRFFKLEPERLQSYDERRYNLIKEIMEELKDEKT